MRRNTRRSITTLTLLERPILEKIDTLPLAGLPMLTDVVDVLLTFPGRYATLPKLTNPHRYADFDNGGAPILQDMALLGEQHVPRRNSWPILADHHFLIPEGEGWHDALGVELQAVCDQTWDIAPDAFRAIIKRRSEQSARRAVGMLRERWRCGQWLDDAQLARAVPFAHSFLPKLVCKTLMAEDKALFVPQS